LFRLHNFDDPEKAKEEKRNVYRELPVDHKTERLRAPELIVNAAVISGFSTIDSSPLLRETKRAMSSGSAKGLELGDISVGETDAHPLLKNKPGKPNAPELPVLESHEKGCDDKYRIPCGGHEMHWTECIVLLLLLVTLLLTALKQWGAAFQEREAAALWWILCMVCCGFGNLILFNIGWVQSDAEYSRRINNACKDVEKENEYMSRELSQLTQSLKEQSVLARKAAQQTVALGKSVGVLDTSGRVIGDKLKNLENFMDSPLIQSHSSREKRINQVMKEVNLQNMRDNHYHDLISSFKAVSRESGDAAKIKLKDKKRMSKLNREMRNYNNTCKQSESDPIILEDIAKADKNDDKVLSLWEFCEHVYHNTIKRELGAEPRMVITMQEECKKMKKRIAEINKTLAGQQAPEELEDDFEIDTECVAFAPAPGK
jgi:hypothetical protein